MTDLIEFLRARRAEETARAEAAGGDEWTAKYDAGTVAIQDSEREPVVYDEGSPTAGQIAHIVHHDPARVLREIEAKRGILDLHGGDLGEQSMFCAHCEHASPCPTLRLLALPYADHPDYRQDWTP